MTKYKTHNMFSIQGRLTENAEIKYSQTEGGYIQLSLKVLEEAWNPETRKFDLVPSRLPLSYYSKNPEQDAVGLNKGVAVIVDGHLRGRSYTDNRGAQRETADIRVDNIDIIEPFLSRQTAQESATAQQATAQPLAQQQEQPAPKRSVEPPPYDGPTVPVEKFDDDPIPF